MKKELLSPSVGAISPLMQRRMPEKEQPSSQAQIQHLARPSSSRQVSDVDSALSQLDVLKGAADDPDKDYLEPLFRIQAHESPSSRSRSLPELIRNSAKVISTEDQFTANHERLAFRMLRRIYQLQNANKWSLRQMEKQKEPEQPFTHHDHMMEEMKWMRRDFKAERKLKVRVCAWLARSCAEWCNASLEERAQLQVKIKPPRLDGGDEEHHESVPELEHCGDSAPEDDAVPGTPRASSPLPRTIVVPPELLDTVEELQRNGSLSKTLSALPRTGILTVAKKHEPQPYTAVSKFVEGKVLPTICQPSRKRSRYDYEDEEEVLASEPGSKRLRDEQHLPAEGLDCALFHPDNKPIRDRLHSNNAFRPPSEFLMPSTPFYEFRNGSQWIWEDDQKLRKLAKEYSFNWSLISDEMALSTRYKSSAERRTPWECFERWVELESLPADMRKTMYFKTWFSRLEQSQQAAERRYQAQVQAIQQQAAQSGGQTHIPMRRRTTPSRVEKRRSTRYLWMVEGFRKLAKKREQTAWKQAETARAAAQRKSQNDNSNQVRQVKMTPQEFSKKRHERDLQIAEAQRQHRAKLIEAQQRQIALARVAAHQQQTGTLPAPQHPQLGQQRPLAANMPAQQAQMQASGQQMPNVNAPMASQQQQQARGPLQMATRNGHLAPPQMNGQVIPQAQMQARAAQMAQHQQKMQTGAQQMRNPQSYAGQQQYGMASGHLISPGGGLTNSQQLQNNQALLAAFQQQQQQQQQHHHQQQQQQQQQQQGVNNQPQAMTQSNGTHAMNGSPSMPPPPTPQNAPQQLSSGHIPQIVAIKSQLRGTNPQMTDDQLNNLASQQLKNQSQSSNQARQNAMNAAAGIPSQSHAGMSPSTYAYSHTAYQNNRQLGNNPNGANGMYPANGDGATQQSQAQPQPQQQQQPQQPPPPPPPPQQQQQQQPAPNMSPVANNASPTSESQAAYRQKMWKMQQMQMQSPNAGPATLNGSPGVAHASPNMMPASPSMQYANMQMNQMGQMNQIPGMNGAQRPPSRSNTPQTRVGSSGSGVAMGSGIQSPGGMGQAQGSPRNMTASVTR
jgi:chromatin modification-related protein VID21